MTVEIEERRDGVKVEVDLDAIGREPPPEVAASADAELEPKMSSVPAS